MILLQYWWASGTGALLIGPLALGFIKTRPMSAERARPQSAPIMNSYPYSYVPYENEFARIKCWKCAVKTATPCLRRETARSNITSRSRDSFPANLLTCCGRGCGHATPRLLPLASQISARERSSERKCGGVRPMCESAHRQSPARMRTRRHSRRRLRGRARLAPS